MKTPQIKILVGAPGSGKTTFSKYWIRTEPNWMRVSRDDFRLMHFTFDNLSWEEETGMTKMIEGAVFSLLDAGFNVLFDATHCRSDYIDAIIKTFNHKADINFKVFDIPLDELKIRCEERKAKIGKHIPVGVIERYHRDLQKLIATFDFSDRPKISETATIAKIQNTELPKAIICDLDGTLSLLNGRNPFDASHCDRDLLNEPVARVLKNYHSLGYKILLLSGREDAYKEPTLRFLSMHEIPFDALWMRKAKDHRKDAIIKKELFDAHIEGQFFVEFVLDDRDQVVDLWRKQMKLTCFQVNYGDF